jgi:glycine/D-amino acid oxidase-like deaminating enzyme
MRSKADIVICGAGIAGAAAAFHLAVRRDAGRIILVDEYEPLTLTSDKGTQGYRNWWPGPDDTMLRLVSRSIDLLEETARESGNGFRMNRRGYLFATGDSARLAEMEAVAAEVSSYGMGPLRRHTTAASYAPAPAEGFEDQPDGADILVGDAVRAAFPYLAPDTAGAVHVRRAGTMNAVVLGSWFLKRAFAHGTSVVRDRVVAFDTSGGRVRSVQLASGHVIETDTVILAAGPGVQEVGEMLGLDLPVKHELHAKMRFRDTRGIVPRGAPFVIWNDPIEVGGETLPAGMHMRPVDLSHGDEVYLIWTYETDPRRYVWPPTFDASYPEIVLRGFARMIPGAAPYVGQGATGYVDGGYYCKTPENRPLVGPLPVEGVYIVAALSGIGLMSSHACGELVAQHVTGETLPDYARWFLPSRYDDPQYRVLVEEWGSLVGQL